MHGWLVECMNAWMLGEMVRGMDDGNVGGRIA